MFNHKYYHLIPVIRLQNNPCQFTTRTQIKRRGFERELH